MKQMGRKHRPFYRICAMDRRSPRDGKVLEELGTYDPMISDVDARAVFDNERVQYWLSVGAQPSDKVAVLIRKYGPEGSHVDQQKAALDKLSQPKSVPDPGPAASKPKSEEEEPPAEEAKAPEGEQAEAAATEAPAEEQAAESKPEEAAAEEKPEEKAEEKSEASAEAAPEEKAEEKTEEEKSE